MENFPIEELELGVRSYNCLKRVGIETIGDLTSKSESELAAIPNFGRKSIDEVRETLAAHGLTLKGEELPTVTLVAVDGTSASRSATRLLRPRSRPYACIWTRPASSPRLHLTTQRRETATTRITSDMRHAKAGKKLGRDSAHRKALYSNLTGALIEHGRIETTRRRRRR